LMRTLCAGSFALSSSAALPAVAVSFSLSPLGSYLLSKTVRDLHVLVFAPCCLCLSRSLSPPANELRCHFLRLLLAALLQLGLCGVVAARWWGASLIEGFGLGGDAATRSGAPPVLRVWLSTAEPSLFSLRGT
jgi:hypothetical protein